MKWEKEMKRVIENARDGEWPEMVRLGELEKAKEKLRIIIIKMEEQEGLG